MEPQIDFSKYHSIRGAAKMSGVTANSVRNWILTGRLRAEKSHGRFLIHEDDIKEIMRERELLSEAEKERLDGETPAEAE